MIASLIQDPWTWLTSDLFQNITALGVLGLFMVGLFAMARPVVNVVIQRIAETGRFNEQLATRALERTQDIAQQAVQAQLQGSQTNSQLAGVIKESTTVIGQLQQAIEASRSETHLASLRHGREHGEIKQAVKDLGGRLEKKVPEQRGEA